MSLEDQQFTKWLRRPTEFIASAWYLLASAGQFFVSYLVSFLVGALSLFGWQLSDAAFTYTASTIAQIALFLLPVVIYAVKHDGVERSMRLNAPRWDALLITLLAAPIGVLASDKLSTWWMLLIESLGGTLYSSAVPVPTTLPELGIALLFSALVPGICEEVFFRGGLMGAWERRGSRQALVITAALFALMHGSVLGLPIQLMMGFVLGYLVLLSDSLFVGMAYHISHNAWILILTYLTRDSAAMTDSYRTLTESIRMSTGFGALFFETILWTALYGGILILLILSLKKRGAQVDKIIEGDKEPVSWQELIVLLAGLMTVGVMLASDLMRVCGML